MARPEPNEVNFEIDGREVRAPEGSMLVDAAKLQERSAAVEAAIRAEHNEYIPES